MVDDRWYDPDDNETYENGHWECPLCGEHIRPGRRRVPPSTHRHAGEAAWFLNDEPVSEEKARALVEEAQATRAARPAAAMPVYALGEREPAAFIQPDGTFDRDTEGLPRAMFADVPVHLHLSADITLAPLRMANDQTGPVGMFERARSEWMRA